VPSIGKYRINSPTIALFLEEGHHIARTVPVGSIITVDSGPADIPGDRLVDVTWNGRKVQMFAQDLRTRGEKIA